MKRWKKHVAVAATCAPLLSFGSTVLAAPQELEDLDTTLGVWRVRNFLRLRPQTERSDYVIANNVRDALRRDPYVDRYDITVNVDDGKAQEPVGCRNNLLR
jgi:hypothetical protein